MASNVLDLKKAFDGDAVNSATPDGSEWCINAGPFVARRWNKFNGATLVDKLFFSCVINFCTVPANEPKCFDVRLNYFIFSFLLVSKG